MSITVRGGDQLAAKTDRIASRLEQPAGATSDLAAVFQRRMQARFSSNGEGDWAPLDAATVTRWGEHPPLRLTGALQAAMTGGTVDATADQIRYLPADPPFYGSIVNADRPILPPAEQELADKAAGALDAYVMGGG